MPNNFPFSEKNIEKYSNLDCYYQIDTVEFVNQDIYFNYLTNIKSYLENWSGYIPPVLIGDSYYLEKEDKQIQNLLQKISDNQEFKTAILSQHFKSVDEHWDIFQQFWSNNQDIFEGVFGEAISNTKTISDKCNFEIKMEKLHLPLAKIDGVNSKDNLDFFKELIRKGMDKLGLTGGDLKYEERVEEEFNIIVGADLENYFLLLWDIANYCKRTNNYIGIARIISW